MLFVVIRVLAVRHFYFSSCRSKGNSEKRRASIAVLFLILVHVGVMVILKKRRASIAVSFLILLHVGAMVILKCVVLA